MRAKRQQAAFNHAIEQEINNNLMKDIGAKTNSALILESGRFMDEHDDCSDLQARSGGWLMR